MPIRLDAVHYLNVRPLVHGLDRDPGFELRYDAPSRCAELLAAGAVDLASVPSIEFARGEGYRVVPGISIASHGPIASVALFSRVPVDRIRTVAADTSSRTSTALLRILCADRFAIDPEFQPMPPDPAAMLAACDAALLIGDPALFLDHQALGAAKIDLGAEWTALTGLPFVWAFWAGSSRAVDAAACRRLQRARDEGLGRLDEIAAAYCAGAPDRVPLAAQYLRDNVRYGLGASERAGIDEYYRRAAKLGLIAAPRELDFFDA
jgi:chorismate dehydratase